MHVLRFIFYRFTQNMLLYSDTTKFHKVITMRYSISLLIIGFIALPALAQYAPAPTNQAPTQPTNATPGQPTSTTTTQPTTQTVFPGQSEPRASKPQAPAAAPVTPADIIKTHGDAIANTVRGLTPCTNPSGCHLQAISFMDFAIYFQFCPQLNGWDISYSSSPDTVMTLSKSASGDCQVSLNNPPKTCVLSREQAAMISSFQTLLALYQLDNGQTPANPGTYIQPLIDCFKPPSAATEQLMPPGTIAK